MPDRPSDHREPPELPGRAERDDSLMDRFDRDDLRRYKASDAVWAIMITTFLLVLLAGDSVRAAAEKLPSGVGREAVAAVGVPTGWIADRLPLADTQRDLTAALSPDRDLVEGGGFDEQLTASGGAVGVAPIPPVTAAAFDPTELGVEPQPKLELDTLLVTGDSMSQPLDAELARRLTDAGVETIREPHLGTGISRTDFVDWGQLSVTQVAEHEPDAIVVFIGAGDGYPIPGPDGAEVDCCGPEWAALYAQRARQMMDTYRQSGAARVYWLTIPTPRQDGRAAITRVVNAAVEVAAQPWASEVRIVDLVPTLSPGGSYSDALELDGRERVVRASDGLHLNEAGAELAAEAVLEQLDRDFER